MARLTVRYSPYYPPDRCWISEVRSRFGTFPCWRSAYGEVLELGLEDLAWQDREERRLPPVPVTERTRVFRAGLRADAARTAARTETGDG